MDESEWMENQATGGSADGERGAQEGVVDAAVEGGEGGAAEGADEGGEERESGGAGGEETGSGPSHEDNAAAAAQRLQRQFDEQISGLGVPNPYTGEPFGSFQEFKDYAAQFQREQLEAESKRTGKTVDELREERENQSFLTRKRREEKEQRKAVEAARERQAFLDGDLRDFLKTHPDVDVVKLEQNAKFQKFAGDRLYRVPLGRLYDDFVEIVGDAGRSALDKAAGRAERSTGGGQGGGVEILTSAQRSALEEWNRDNPDMQMNAKEFLNR